MSTGRTLTVSSSGGGGGPDSNIRAVTQTAHGLVVGMPIHLNGAVWEQADADDETKSTDAMVESVADANNFVARLAGPLTLTTVQWDARTGQTGGLTPGEYYWLSATAGSITTTAPTGLQQSVGVADSTTTLLVRIGEVFGAAEGGGGGGGSSGALVKLATYTVTGGAVTNITFSGLDLSAYDAFELDIKLKNATASTPDISLFYNGDTTATNYYRQMQHVVDTVTTGTRTNNGAIDTLGASVGCTADVKIIRDVDGYPRAFYRVARLAVSGITYLRGAHIRNNTANVTSITLSSSVASALANGSTAVLYGRTTGSGSGGGGSTGDPYWYSRIAVLPMNGANNSTFLRDHTGRNWTPNGNVKITTADSKFGGSCSTFDGAGAFWSHESHSDFDFQKALTVEGWAKPTAITAGYQGLFSRRDNVAPSLGLSLFLDPSGHLYFYWVKVGGGAWCGPLITTTAVSTSAWWHWAVSLDGQTARVFYNGAMEASTTTFSGVRSIAVPNTSFLIGRGLTGSGTTYDYNGKMADVRLSNRCEYAASFTPPSSANLTS